MISQSLRVVLDEHRIQRKGREIAAKGMEFAGGSRLTLLTILRDAGRIVGSAIHLSKPNRRPHRFPRIAIDCPGADGINSRIREMYAAHFKPRSNKGDKFAWLGSTGPPLMALHVLLQGDGAWADLCRNLSIRTRPLTWVIRNEPASWSGAWL